MHLRFGFDIALDLPTSTPLVLLLHTRPEHAIAMRRPQLLKNSAQVPTSTYFDSFNNVATRLTAPAGTIELSMEGLCEVSDQPDPVDRLAIARPVPELPDESLMYLLPSRYCESDLLGEFAWSQFGQTPVGWERVQAICDFVHGHLRFSYPEARPTRTAFQAWQERVGVCRDFAHLGITLCRCLNIPARYVTGYLGDIGVPRDPAPMDFSAWFEVLLGDRWFTFDPRHNARRIGRLPIARGRDAADCAMITSFGPHALRRFVVVTEEVPAPASASAAA